MVCCIEYNDLQFRQFVLQGDVLYDAIAAASTATGSLTFGASAWSHARTHPQQFNARFLTSVNAEPIQGDMRPARNQADLIYHQFNQLNTQTADTLLAVPGYLTDEQLGLLMGIAQQAGVAVKGFVDLQLAQALTENITQPCQVLDVELQRVLLSDIQLQDDQLSVSNCHNLDGTGLINILDGWMNLIADTFVHQTRFDPMHAGACEQQLLDQLTSWLHQGKVAGRIAIEHLDVMREIDLEPEAIHDKLEQRLDGLFRFVKSDVTLLVSHRAQRVPGLIECLTRRGIDCQLAQSELPASGIAQLLADMPDDEVVRVTSATIARQTPEQAASAVPADAAVTDNTTRTVRVTHLLQGATAYPLTDGRFADLNLLDLQPGQTLSIGPDTFTAIEVI